MAALLEVEDLTVSFARGGEVARVVSGVSYTVEQGETLGIVGESGSGKSVHVLAMLGLLPSPPGYVEAGRVRFGRRDLLRLPPSSLRDVRGGADRPRLPGPDDGAEPGADDRAADRRGLRATAGSPAAPHGHARRSSWRWSASLSRNGVLDQFPHELSGGMRQRVMIAIAIACEPALLIADEPTTALDVTVQGQILDLLGTLKQRLGMTMIWITHDMGVIAAIADRVQVMYGGHVMERGPARAVFHDPRNAYTWSLLRALPYAERAPGAASSSSAASRRTLSTRRRAILSPRAIPSRRSAASVRCRRSGPFRAGRPITSPPPGTTCLLCLPRRPPHDRAAPRSQGIAQGL